MIVTDATCHQAEIIRGDDIDITMAERRILTLGTRTNFLTQLHSSFQVWPPSDEGFYLNHRNLRATLFQVKIKILSLVLN